MTAGELIRQADELRPNAYGAAQKLRWLRRLDGQILAELEETHEPGPPAPARSAQSEALSFRASPQAGVAIRTPETGEETGETDCHGPQAALAMTGETGESPAPPIPNSEFRIPNSPVLPAVYTPETELLAPFPWGEELYLSWLFCQIDLHNGEIQKYNQSLSLLAAAWRSLADRVNRTRRPRSARRAFKF